ncbi:MAG: response regulator [Deltaproteobacteria bacterium]|nr:response regulator [Deltaproteobacteria bacterium]
MPNSLPVHILLVEDEDVDVMAVRRAFRSRRIANEMTVARDGVAALELLRGSEAKPPLPRPLIILLDLNMPRMNGIEFLAELRGDAELKDSIVFILTTSKADEDKAAAYDKHIAGYIVKSDVGGGFLALIEMLDSYWRIVEFP